MIKSVAYFPLQVSQNSGPVYHAVLDCLQARGIAIQENSWEADAAVIWSVLWHGRMRDNQQVYQHYRSLGRSVIIIEVGALYRGTTWKIALNHITRNGHYGHLDRLDWDRPKKLGVSLAYPVSTRPHVIIAGQHRNSLQLEGVDQELWISQTVDQLRTHTDRPIVVRPHPRCDLDSRRLPPGIEIERPRKIINTYDSYDMHFDCHAVINYNSGPGIQAAVSGTRPIVDASSLAHPVSVPLNMIEQPYDIDRDQWLVELCHTEYTVREIEQGLWLQRLCLV